LELISEPIMNGELGYVGDAAPAPRNLAPRSPALRISAALIGIGLAALAAAVRSDGASAAIAASIALVLVSLGAIDLDQRRIPNIIVLPATAVVLVARLVEYPHRIPEFALAPLAVALVLLLPNVVNRSAMGLGDVKLGLFLGAGLGWSGLAAIFVAFACAAPVSAAILIRGGRAARHATIPFGPFLAFGGLVILIAPHL
jgi:leader peptidase (prepilin peptidase)/N-methyltransferase